MLKTITGVFFGSNERTYGYMLASLILFATVTPLLPRAGRLAGIDDYLLILVLVAAVGRISQNRRLLWFGALLWLPAMVARITHAHMTDMSAAGATLVAASTIAFFCFLVTLVLNDLVRGSRHISEKITGAIVAYLLIGLLWTFVYGLVELLNPGSFDLSGTMASWIESHPNESPTSIFLYYSFVTLTTLGFGDISPVGATARTLTWLEAVVGQLFIAVTIARLVGIHAGTMQHDAASSVEKPDR